MPAVEWSRTIAGSPSFRTPRNSRSVLAGRSAQDHRTDRGGELDGCQVRGDRADRHPADRRGGDRVSAIRVGPTLLLPVRPERLASGPRARVVRRAPGCPRCAARVGFRSEPRRWHVARALGVRLHSEQHGSWQWSSDRGVGPGACRLRRPAELEAASGACRAGTWTRDPNRLGRARSCDRCRAQKP